MPFDPHNHPARETKLNLHQLHYTEEETEAQEVMWLTQGPTAIGNS